MNIDKLKHLTDEEAFEVFKQEIIDQIKAYKYTKHADDGDGPHYIIMVCPTHPTPEREDYIVATAGCNEFLMEGIVYLEHLLSKRFDNDVQDELRNN